ncbi:ATP-dependent DNA helicase [Halanaerocella petrolearia]
MQQVLDSKEIKNFFAPDGQLAGSFANYEYRTQQEEMAVKIAKVFKQNQHLLVEAGTGTGKSFAYLVPSILSSLKQDESIVVSTNTINLQEQLMAKDIPTLQQLLDIDCKVVLAKGRSNYLCLRRLNQQQRSEEPTSELYQQLQDITKWAAETETGCRSDLDFKVAIELWQNLSSQAQHCLSHRCPYYDRCHFNFARNKLEEADIIVANHHLLFSDISLRQTGEFENQQAVLPPYSKIVFDEAHNIEEIATNYLGIRVNSQDIVETLELLYHPQNKTGALLQIRAEIGQLEKGLKAKLQKAIDQELFPAVAKLLDQTKGLKDKVIDFMEEHRGKKVRLTEKVRQQNMWQKVLAVEFENLLLNLNDLYRKLNDLLSVLTASEVAEFEAILALLENKIRVISETATILTEITEFANEESVYWLEKEYDGYSLRSAPLDIAQKLEDNLLNKVDSVVFTSATLTVDNSFAFIKENLGLVDQEVETLDLGSPFDYGKQLQVGLIKNLVGPKQGNFIKQVVSSIQEIINSTQGRTLLLFNSYSRLNKVYRELATQVGQLEVDYLLRQGQKSRQQLLADFKEKKGAVLLGTSSFWEGVDIPGPTLSCVIIVKLPFLVPSEPYIAAKLDAINESGSSSFYEYMLPKAVIKFRQGCGRLIRSKSDKGWLFILDNRVLKKNYGNYFLNALPTTDNTFVDRLDDLTARLEATL